MRDSRTHILLLVLVAACAGNPDRHTLAELHDMEPDMAEVRVERGLDQAMLGYRTFLEETPESALTPEAMRRLADLKVEKEYGVLGDGELVELPAPETTPPAAHAELFEPRTRPPAARPGSSESESDFERRATAEVALTGPPREFTVEVPGGEEVEWAGPHEAIELYDRILATYPTYPHNDQVLYQKARAYDELGRADEAIAVMERLIAEYPHSRYIDEVQFRRAEYFFVRKKYLDAEESYLAVTQMGIGSEFYELALYKLGWTFYKQELHEEALDSYVALLDYKVSTGYDFDQSQEEADERRIADTYRVISLSFSNLGGPDAVSEYFATNGNRSYEDRIYRHLGEFYLDKLRYHDAAAAYKAFVELHPLHRTSPHFGMRVVEIYEAGGFPILVLESKKEFAATYGLQSEYWRHFAIDDSPEVRTYLKSNLKDLAGHYHALYQGEEPPEDKTAHFEEALRWYRDYLGSFPEDPDTPGIHYRLADLLLEHQDFGEAAREYERTAYAYPEHAQSAAAGYAAIYAYREGEKAASGAEQAAIRQEAVTSTLRFVDAFPEHEHAAVVLGAAVEDLYDMDELELAIAKGQRLIQDYPGAATPIRRSAWAVVAHSHFDLADYEQAEQAYARVLSMTAEDDDSRQAVVENLAAAIYKQGEEANAAEDYRLAADHFLRISEAAPTSEIRPAAEYDAGTALIRLEDWVGAAAVLESFREAHPDHELHREATKQIAFVYREAGNLSRSAGEYERLAAEAEDAEVRSEALLLAGELYEDSRIMDRALAAYLEYVSEFPTPVEIAVETRFKIAEIYKQQREEDAYHEQLQEIVEIDRSAGAERTARIRYLAAQSALVLTEETYARFEELELVQPFERNLREKQRRMDATLDALAKLVDYEVAEVTAAATFYMAEVYFEFSEALTESERPTDLEPAEMQAYEMALEEEAFPFEERAIEFHEKNLELMAGGIYNPWIEKSLGKLAGLVPGRYAKVEMSTGFIDSLGSYAYRSPRPRGTGAEPTQTEEATESTEPILQPAPGSEAGAVHERPATEAVPAG